MSDYKRVPTSAEVWAVLRAQHPEMQVFGSYSAPDGDQFGDPSKGKMFTSYGFEHGDYPVIEAQTTWDIDPDAPHKRPDERHEYWLCLPAREDEMDWINCSDRLPELKDGSVLVYFSKTGSIEIVHIEDYFKDLTAGHDEQGRPAFTKWYTWQAITHWMPLPEAPKIVRGISE